MPRPINVGVGVALVVMNEQGQVLLHKRKGAHYAGHWSCIGGWLDFEDETAKAAIVREAKEEAALIVNQAYEVGHTVGFSEELQARVVTLYFATYSEPGSACWSGTPTIMEPNKCEEWRWCKLNNLPQPLFPGLEDKLKDMEACASSTEDRWVRRMARLNLAKD